MDGPTDTLFSFFEYRHLTEPALFINARPHTKLAGADITLHQAFRPYALELQAQGLQSTPVISVGVYETVLVLLSKNAEEAKYEIAKGLSVLKEGGLIVCAGANDAGGKRAKKILEEFGVEQINEVSGNKARAAGGEKKVMTSEARGVLQRGALQRIGDGFYSQPGLFSWDRPDKGSEILVNELPDDLQGAGADFGCGYGYLASHVLKRCKKIKSFICIDADNRAVEACKKNLKDIKTPVTYLWEDLTREPLAQKNLDFIVMNPPFHEGKKTDAEIGKAFIRRAAESLKSGGELWMVANKQLPYEADAREVFSTIDKFYEGGGYKILRCVR
jgi:16S rRNA (guanine1207-N2)-methyltransferase